jgi:hypothetical protein
MNFNETAEVVVLDPELGLDAETQKPVPASLTLPPLGSRVFQSRQSGKSTEFA